MWKLADLKTSVNFFTNKSSLFTPMIVNETEKNSEKLENNTS